MKKYDDDLLINEDGDIDFSCGVEAVTQRLKNLLQKDFTVEQIQEKMTLVLDSLYQMPPIVYQMPPIVMNFIICTESICECGKDKHGFASHSNWCPKHEK